MERSGKGRNAGRRVRKARSAPGTVWFPDGPWKGIDDVEFATLEWVDWFNHRRLLEPIGDIPPAEFEAAHYRKETLREDHDTEAGLILSSRGKRVVMLIHDLDVG